MHAGLFGGNARGFVPAFGGRRLGAHMLVIRRRAGEAIVLNGETEIEIIEISRTRVKLGVRAPLEVMVTRRESLAIAEENKKALDLLAAEGTIGVRGLVTLIRDHSIG